MRDGGGDATMAVTVARKVAHLHPRRCCRRHRKAVTEVVPEVVALQK